MAENLDIRITATDATGGVLSDLNKDLTGLDTTAKKASKGGGIIGQALGFATGQALFTAGAAGLSALGGQLMSSIGFAREQIEVEKQLNAVLTSTGGAAGLTAEQIKTMAANLQSVTNFGDEAIISGQNLLLTFTNIGSDVFPAATETILNMSQALGQDLSSSAIQLGKALNDPITGVSALSRVGVSFTEQQKEQIKAMQEAGDVAGAQTLILAELEKEFGGSARAMADPAKQLQNSWGDLKEQLGMAVIPVLDSLSKAALPLLQKATEALPPIIADMTQKWNDDLYPALKKIWDFLNAYVVPIFKFMFDVSFKLLGIQIEAVSAIFRNVFLPILDTVWRLIDGTVIRVFGSWQNAFDGIANAINGVIGWIGRMADKLGTLSLPSWLTPGSPTPFELGLRGINDAMSGLNRTMDPFNMGLNGGTGAGASAGAYSNTYNMTFNGGSSPSDTAYAVQDAILRTQRRRGY